MANVPEDTRHWSPFYRLGGVAGRSDFLLNGLMIASIAGASFALLVMGMDHTSGPLHDMPINPLQFGAAMVVLGAALEPIFVLIAGLTTLWVAMFWALVFLGGATGSFTWASMGPHAAGSVLLSGIVMLSTVVFGYANVSKRVRHILGPGAKVHPWSVGICLLGAVPIVGTVLFYGLLLLGPSGPETVTPAEVLPPSESFAGR